MSFACMFFRALKKHGATPRDGIGFTSVQEKRRSRHASQALLLFLRMAMGTIHALASVYAMSAMPLSPFFFPLYPCSDLRRWEVSCTWSGGPSRPQRCY